MASTWQVCWTREARPDGDPFVGSANFPLEAEAVFFAEYLQYPWTKKSTITSLNVTKVELDDMGFS